MKPFKLFLASSLALCSSLTNAGVIINSIDLQMANTNHSVRGASDPDDAFTAAMGAFDAGSQFCDRSLEAFTNVTSRQTCGGSKRNYGALYTISGRNSGITEFEFGLDWGRGGFIMSQAADETQLLKDSSDIWWQRRWGNGDVIPFLLQEQGAFTLTLLGFEGCCDGINSARYRNFDQESFGPLRERSPLSDDPPLDGLRLPPAQLASEPQWQALEVSAVPLPGSLPLLMLGSLLMLLRRGQRDLFPV